MKKLSLLFRVLIMSSFLTGMLLLNPHRTYPAVIDPSFRFSTIESEHFVFHYHQGLDKMAIRAAALSEDIHDQLSPLFQWFPAEKTQVVLIDNMDFANGMATVLPYNAMYIFAVPPLPDMTTGEYDDWLELVLLHEYAHILTLDPAKGYSTITRKIFGKPLPVADPFSLLLFLAAAPPNVLMPDWWAEGIATWAETEFTSSGRGRSSYVEMIFRMAVVEDTLPRIDQLNGDVPFWPSGKIPYLYGMLLEKYIAERERKETLGELSIAHAGRFPFFITAPAVRLTGSHYTGLYRNMIKELKEEQTNKVQQLNIRPLTAFTRIPVRGENVTNPRLSPDGRYLAVNRRDPHDHEEIVILNAETREELHRVRRFPSDHGLSWSPDSAHLYFTQAERRNSYNLYQDIYSYSLEKRSVRRITENARAKDIDISSDGKLIVFVKVRAGRQNIAFFSNESGSVEVMTDLHNSALSSPRWSADGRFVVFSKRDNAGNTSIELLHTGTKTIETLVSTRDDNLYPSWSPDGKFIIYSTDRTGVFNLFACSLADKEIYQISHVLGGAFQPEVSTGDDRIFFSGYSAKGFFVAAMPYDPGQWTSTLSPGIAPSWTDVTVKKGTSDAPNEKEPLPSPAAKGPIPYCPLKTLMPKFWLPALTFDHDGAVFGAFTAGQDVLGYHTYIAQGGIGIGGDGYYDVHYIYDRWTPTFFVRSYSLPFSYFELFDDEEDYYERQSGLVAGLSVPLYSTIDSALRLTAGYHYGRAGHLSDREDRTVQGLEVYEGRRDSVFIGLGYNGTVKYPYSISREEGRNVSLIYRRYDRDLESGLDRNEIGIDYDEYIGMKKHHVLYVNLKGAWSDGDLIAQQAYQIGGTPSVLNVYSIRGFSSGFETGRHVIKGTLEYRAPVKYILRGWNTKPFFWDRVHLAAFADAANVWGFHKGFDINDFSAGIGIEARMDITLGYKMKITPALGIARGVTDGGGTDIYFTVYTEL